MRAAIPPPWVGDERGARQAAAPGGRLRGARGRRRRRFLRERSGRVVREPEPEPLAAGDRPRGGSGSKRTRAARGGRPPARGIQQQANPCLRVNKLSEKRRRSRTNEKMKALQSLIPNSNKTDKASMLDEHKRSAEVQVIRWLRVAAIYQRENGWDESCSRGRIPGHTDPRCSIPKHFLLRHHHHQMRPPPQSSWRQVVQVN